LWLSTDHANKSNKADLLQNSIHKQISKKIL
jgi:hypothetical protein